MAFHHESNCKTACTSTITLSFPFPFPVVCPSPLPSKHAPTAKAIYCMFSRGKVLTHRTETSRSCCVGTVAQRGAPPGAKSTGTRAISFLPELTRSKCRRDCCHWTSAMVRSKCFARPHARYREGRPFSTKQKNPQKGNVWH